MGLEVLVAVEVAAIEIQTCLTMKAPSLNSITDLATTEFQVVEEQVAIQRLSK